MTAEIFDRTLNELADTKPFRAFTVGWNDGQQFEIDRGDKLAVRDGVAVFLAPGGMPILFDHKSVAQIHVVPPNNPAE